MIRLFKDPFFDVLDELSSSNHNIFEPKTKINKTEDGYKVFVSVPGLTKDDLKITLKEGILKISYDNESKTDTQHFVSKFDKSYTIPDNVSEKEIVGKVENGLLEITLPIGKKKPVERFISLN
jgi:HSP20 family protein